MTMDGRILDRLFEVIASRADANPDTSWTAKLLSHAPELPARKLHEEVGEAVIEAMKGDTAALTKESADVIYHLLVLMASMGISPQDVWQELKNRESLSGIAEKASREPKL